MTHRCPAPKCPAQVSDAVFCCPPHWFVLPAPVRRAIGRTSRMSILAADRRHAIEQALRVFRQLDTKQS